MAKVIINGVKEDKELLERQNGFNPETGEPNMEIVVANGFNPETGAPVYVPVRSEGFDPETGERLYVAVTDSNRATNKVTETPYSGAKKSKKGLIIALVAVVVIVLLVGIGSLAASLFVSPIKQIELATYNTIKEDTFGKLMVDSAEIFQSTALTADADFSYEDRYSDVTFKGTAAMDTSKCELYVAGNVDAMGLDEDVQFYMNDKKFQLYVPDIYDSAFEYNYTAKNNGFLADIIEDETDGTIDDVNTMLQCAAAMIKDSEKYSAAQKKAAKDSLDKIKIKKCDSESIEIDDKERKCKGYNIEIPSSVIDSIYKSSYKAARDTFGKNYDKFFEAFGNLIGESADSLVDEFEEEVLDSDLFEDMDDIEFQVYLYKNKLAAITADVDGVKLTIEFNGGDHRSSNMTITAKSRGDKYTIKRKSSMDGGKEKGSVSVDGVGVDYSYDTKTGKLSIEALGEELECKYIVEAGKSVEYAFEYSMGKESIDVSGKFTKGAKMGSIKAKDVFDLGTADEDDFEDLISEVGSALYKFY